MEELIRKEDCSGDDDGQYKLTKEDIPPDYYLNTTISNRHSLPFFNLTTNIVRKWPPSTMVPLSWPNCPSYRRALVDGATSPASSYQTMQGQYWSWFPNLYLSLILQISLPSGHPRKQHPCEPFCAVSAGSINF